MPKAIFVLAIASLVFSLKGSGTARRASAARPGPSSPTSSPAFQTSLGKKLATGDIPGVRALYQQALTQVPVADRHARALLELGAASCDVAEGKYGPALAGLNRLIGEARQRGFDDIDLKASVNRATIFLRLDNPQAAANSLREVEALILASGEPLALAQAAYANRELDFPRAERLFRMALLSSQDRPDRQQEATLWQSYGHALLLRGDLQQAEGVLTEAYRLTALLSRRQIQAALFYLGWLRRLQGRPAEAEALLDQALARVGQPGTTISRFAVWRELARTSAAVGRTDRALRYYALAVQEADTVRAQMLPSETLRLGTEESLQTLFAEYIALGMGEYQRTGSQATAVRMFMVADAGRAFLFRRSLLSGQVLPPQYQAKLSEFRQLLTATTAAATEADRSRLLTVRMELAGLENELGLTYNRNITDPARKAEVFSGFPEKSGPEVALEWLQGNLKPDEALVSFYTSPGGSFLWAVTSQGFEAHRLPGSQVLRDHANALRSALDRKAASWKGDAAVLAQELFKPLSERVTTRRHWIMSLDGPLFEVPFAALPADPGHPGQFLGEAHTLRQKPAATLRSGGERKAGSLFAGVADAVYNGADSRMKLTGRAQLELQRLPATRSELEMCSRAWGGDSGAALLIGPGVGRAGIESLVAKNPRVLHIGTHVIRHPQAPDQVMIALGLKADGEAEFLTPAEIVRWRSPLGLVTLSGCGSGGGESRPGLGLFGLTRAWLVAGAESVVSSYWPIPDDDGQMLAAMYEELRSKGGGTNPTEVAAALQKAQARMRASGGWRTHPFYWAAFFVVGKE